MGCGRPPLKPGGVGGGGSGGYPLGRRVKLRRRKVAPGPEISSIFRKKCIFRFEPGPRSARRAGFFTIFRKMSKKGPKRAFPGKSAQNALLGGSPTSISYGIWGVWGVWEGGSGGSPGEGGSEGGSGGSPGPRAAGGPDLGGLGGPGRPWEGGLGGPGRGGLEGGSGGYPLGQGSS